MNTKPFSREVALNPNAGIVLQKRYLQKNDDGTVKETPEELFKRVAMNIAMAEKKFDPNADELKYAAIFYDEMADFRFLPNSPTLMNAGAVLQQLSACFVLPVGDSLAEIFDAVKYTAIIHKSGGGTGFSFSRLRPKDDCVKTTKGVSSGPVSFMSVFDAATETIKQGGTRRGANMGLLRVDHPDIKEFIFAKKDKKKLTNFNLSVAVTDEFMEAVKNSSTYALKSPKDQSVVNVLSAAEIWNSMVQLAWEGGDPGVVFIDRINKHNPTPQLGEIESTNPCGEQPLLPYESCNLGSINLERFTAGRQMDWGKLKTTVHNAVRFLDDVIEMNRYPLDIIEETTKKNRKIGLGIMGWADMLAALEIPYNSEEAVELAEKVMKFIQEEGRAASSELAKVRGSFPTFPESIYPKMGFTELRNATITTIAPTGTISIIAGASSGIEPFFALAFYRNVLDNNKLVEVNPHFLAIAEREGFYSQEMIEQLANVGRLEDIEDVPQKWKDIFVTAHDISPLWHVRMQAAFQKYTDNAVSKTVNFNHSATVEDVDNVYKLAYELGCKGITIYRDGSRSEQVINLGTKLHEEEGEIKRPRPRPHILVGKTIEMDTGCGKLYVTINQDDTGKIFEVFTHIGKAGGCAQSQCEALGRLISLALRSGVAPDAIIRQIKSICCYKQKGSIYSKVESCPDGVAKAIEIALSGVFDIKVTKQPTIEDFIGEEVNYVGGSGACPDCGGHLEYAEGCIKCSSCGYSQCS
jgi:ribonucleoside-diphosphate reductase alpha chain